MKNLMKRFVREEEGQDLIEYALLVVFIALLVVTVLPGVGSAISLTFTNITDCLNDPSSCPTAAAPGGGA